MTVLAALFLLVPLAAVPASAAPGDGQLSVLHGIPGLTVDVYVNGAETLPDFEFGTLAGPLTLPSGSYDVEIMADGDVPPGDMPLLSGVIELPPGANVTAVANLTADGMPTISMFNNDTTLTNAGQARVTARHVAKAPAVDITADGAVLFADVENGESGSADVPAGTYGVAINAAGGAQVFPAAPDTIPVDAASNTSVIAYAIGDIAGEFTVVAQVISLGAPDGYGNISVVHGIPGLTVDVYLNGQLTIPSFTPETITGRILIPAGTYDIALYAEDADPLATAPALSVPGVAVPAGTTASVVAHLAVGGAPTATVFVDDLSKTAGGEGRVTVRHTADAPAVDVTAEGVGVLFGNVENGMGGSADVASATYDVALDAPPGSGTQVYPASGFVSLPVTEGANTFVYAIGTFGGDFTLITSVVDGLGGFDDTTSSVHEDNIVTMSIVGITKVDDSYRPTEDVTRGQMAAFLRRALNLPTAPAGFDPFTDDDTSIFEDDINSIAYYGITLASGDYRPSESVTRGQMAAFITRAFQLEANGATPFTDIDGSIFEGDIESIYAAGITVGTTPTTYSPSDPVTRGQMATFLARALGFSS
jgi:hypothetical protein